MITLPHLCCRVCPVVRLFSTINGLVLRLSHIWRLLFCCIDRFYLLQYCRQDMLACSLIAQASIVSISFHPIFRTWHDWLNQFSLACWYLCIFLPCGPNSKIRCRESPGVHCGSLLPTSRPRNTVCTSLEKPLTCRQSQDNTWCMFLQTTAINFSSMAGWPL